MINTEKMMVKKDAPEKNAFQARWQLRVRQSAIIASSHPRSSVSAGADQPAQ
jgi:hypothetical protein